MSIPVLPAAFASLDDLVGVRGDCLFLSFLLNCQLIFYGKEDLSLSPWFAWISMDSGVLILIAGHNPTLPLFIFMLQLPPFRLEDTHSSGSCFLSQSLITLKAVLYFLAQEDVALHSAQWRTVFRNQDLGREALHVMFSMFLGAPHNISVFSKFLLSSFSSFFFLSHWKFS